MGIIYYVQKKYVEAIECFKKALGINPKRENIYINLFELQLIESQTFDQRLEKQYVKLFKKQKNSFVKYEMLKILQTIVSGKDVDLEEWRNKYDSIPLDNYNFDKLREWIDNVEDDKIKAKLKEALAIFEKH